MMKSIQLQDFLSSQILGDGSVRRYDGKVVSSYYLTISHCENQLDYLRWKTSILQSLLCCDIEIKGPYRNNASFDNGQDLFMIYVRIPNNSIPIFKHPADLIYNLSPLGLLTLWLDDGSITVHKKRNGYSVSRFGYLNTQAFDADENGRISVALMKKFSINSVIHIDRGGVADPCKTYFRLYFNATNLRRLIDIIRPWINFIPSNMRYKLNMGYIPTRLKTSAEYARLYNF